MDLPEPRELADNLGGEVNFVKWRPDAGGDLGDNVGWSSSGGGAEGFDGRGGDSEFGALFPGMHERDPAGLAVGKKNRGAVGNINSEADARNSCQKPVGVRDGEMGTCRNFCHMIAMNLLRSGEGHAIETGLLASLELGRSEPPKRIFTPDANIQLGNPQGEGRADPSYRVQGREGFGDHIEVRHSGGKQLELGNGRESSWAIVEGGKCIAADFEGGRNMPDVGRACKSARSVL